MIAAGTQATPLPDAPTTQNTGVELTEIFLSVAPFLNGVQQQLAEQLAAFDPEIAPYAEYALSRQGKQLRAALTGLAANCAGGWNDSVTRAAVIIEMVHLATLVHDDIMDEAEVRRGRPTLASKWGNSVAVLTGDCLFAHSLKLASEFPTTDVCRAVSTATRNVCSGEIIQNNRKGDLQLAEEQYFELIRMKTGELFALACELGVSLPVPMPKKPRLCAATAWHWARPIRFTTTASTFSAQRRLRANRSAPTSPAARPHSRSCCSNSRPALK